MAQLIRCWGCGKEFSSSWKTCPHCGTEYPQGTQCIICDGVSKVTELRPTTTTLRGIPLHKELLDDPHRRHYFAHPHCIDRVKQEYENSLRTTNCPTCRQEIKPVTNMDAVVEYSNCPNCYETTHLYDFCTFCKMAVFKPAAVKITTYANPYWAHKICSRNRPKSIKDSSIRKNTNCFVATAAYESPLASEVQFFRSFRDTILLNSAIGTTLVNFYYAASPPLALLISKKKFLRVAVRNILLNPLLKSLKIFFRL